MLIDFFLAARCIKSHLGTGGKVLSGKECKDRNIDFSKKYFSQFVLQNAIFFFIFFSRAYANQNFP
jgi:hypothetical protein